ncbi:hypothetical protein ACFYOT_39985 [Saccharothrix saharensis]|uniref:hypothetical protein n=1 Tax=Saccharothrix saharensis TaxID=571190 RepID=UPI0036776211
MTGEVMQVGGVVGAVVALRYLTQLIVVVWSLRADKEGRQHAIRLLELLRGGRLARRRSP